MSKDKRRGKYKRMGFTRKTTPAHTHAYCSQAQLRAAAAFAITKPRHKKPDAAQKEERGQQARTRRGGRDAKAAERAAAHADSEGKKNEGARGRVGRQLWYDTRSVGQDKVVVRPHGQQRPDRALPHVAAGQ